MSKPDYDDPTDEDVPTTAGDAMLNAMAFVGTPEKAIIEGDSTIFVHKANAAEQLEARMAELGWEIRRTRPWKKDEGDIELEEHP